MKGEYLKKYAFTSVHPITGRRTRTREFLDVAGLVMIVQDLGVDGWMAFPSTEHLSNEGKVAFSSATQSISRRWQADTLDALLDLLGVESELPRFEAVRFHWQMAEVRDFGIVAPYRILRTHPWRYIVVPTDGRKIAMDLSNGTHISLVPAEIVHYRRDEAGTGRAGWLLIEGNDSGSEPYRKADDALAALRAIADEKFPTTLKETSK